MKKLIILFHFICLYSFSQEYKNHFDHAIQTRCRVIIDNDFGGDPDGLFQLAHHLLSPTVEIRGIIGSIQYENGFYGYPGNTDYSCKQATDLLKTMDLADKYLVVKGGEKAFEDILIPRESEGAKIIIKEAMRDDTDLPLFVICGAGLTNIASAYLMEPKIAEKLTLVWIGGTEYEGLASPPPGASKHWEYNTGIDPIACQVIYNKSNIPIWQVPRNAYRQALVSYSELLIKVKNQGKTGKFLMERLDDLLIRSEKMLGEAYVLGDNPLTLLTALQSSWEVDPSSSEYVLKPIPKVDEKGFFHEQNEGRNIRVYDQLDVRLMFEDLFAKLNLFSNNRGVYKVPVEKN